MTASPHKSLNFFQQIGSLFRDKSLEADKARLEAFLTAFPGEYCGFSAEGLLAYSRGFRDLLKLPRIDSIADIQNVLRPGDSAALESCYMRLRQHGQRFILKVRTLDQDKILRFSGSSGTASDSSEKFDILWIEDVTDQERDIEKTRDMQSQAENELRRLQSVMNAFRYAIWMRNNRGELIWCNNYYAEILKTTPDDVILHQKELPFTADKKVTLKNNRDMAELALQTGVIQKDRRQMITDGNRYLMNINEIPVPHLDITVGESWDISRVEELEREAIRNTTANRNLLEQLRSAIGIFTADQRLEFYNSAYAQLWQLEDQWLNTKPKLGEIMERLRESRRLPEQADFRRFKQSWLDMFTGLIGAHEDMLYLPTGGALRMLVVPHPMGGLMMTFEDVSSRLELETSYNTLIAVQKETLDNLAEGVAAFGGDGRIKLWNPSFARMWKLNPEDLEGQPHITSVVERLEGFFSESEWPAARDNLLSLGLDRSMRDGMIYRNDDTVLEYAAVPLPDGGVMVSLIDVTDTVRVENALRDKTGALEAAERLKLDFLANVSYQLRTPLNALIGFTEILDKEYFGKLNPRQKEYTKGLGEAGERLMSLVNDILDLSTIEAGYMTIVKESVDIHAMLKALYNLTQEWARGQKIEVKMTCAADIGMVQADERRMKQVLLNLIRNAIDFTPAGGQITLSAERRANGVALIVADTGPGIDIQDHERIFKPFEKTDVPRDDKDGDSQGGAGLGLALVKNIVDLHGGRVELDSAQSKGTAIRVILPN
jgi:signal transduction histidine kinase